MIFIPSFCDNFDYNIFLSFSFLGQILFVPKVIKIKITNIICHYVLNCYFLPTKNCMSYKQTQDSRCPRVLQS